MAADLELHLSGGAANVDKNASIGGARSTQAGGVVPEALTANSLFDDVSGAEEQAGDLEYRCVYLRNVGNVDAQNVKVWIQANTSDPNTQIAIGLGASAIGAASIETAVADENTAPGGGVAFTEPADDAGGLAVGTIPAGQHKAVWIRRDVDPAAGPSADQFTIASAFDTAP